MATHTTRGAQAPPVRPREERPAQRPPDDERDSLSGRLAVARQMQRVLGLPLGAASIFQRVAVERTQQQLRRLGGGREGDASARGRRRADARLVEEE